MEKDQGVKYSNDEITIIGDALETYKDEVKKVMVKSEKLGLKEAFSLKKKFLEIEALRSKVIPETKVED